jgi:hypothetical protein
MAVVAALVISSLAGGLFAPVPSAGTEAGGGTGRGSATPQVAVAKLGGTELYGYLPYWFMSTTMAGYLSSVPLTTLELFSVSPRTNGSLDTKLTGYRRITGAIGTRLITEAHARGQRVELAFSSFGFARNEALFASPAPPAFGQSRVRPIDVPDQGGPNPRARRAAGELVALADRLGLDGVNLDIEQLPSDVGSGYATFVAAVATGLAAVRPKAQVSVATAANAAGASMADRALASGADRVFLMGYDFHWSGSQPGAVAPIERADAGATLALAIRQYVAARVPPSRIVLGLPLYGRAWPVIAPYRYAPSVGNGVTWLPEQHVQQLSAAGFAPFADDVEVVEYLPAGVGSGWQSIFYDSPRTLVPKLALARASGYAGAGFWAIGDERGAPGYLALMTDFVAGHITPANAGAGLHPPDQGRCTTRC